MMPDPIQAAEKDEEKYERASGNGQGRRISGSAELAAAVIPLGDILCNSDFGLLDLLILLCRRKQLLLRSTLAAAVLSMAVAFLLPNRYTATANILPPQQSPSLASSLIGQMGPLGSVAALAQKDLGLKNPNDLYIAMLRSRTVEDALIHRFGLLQVYRARKMSEARHDLETASGIALGKEGLVTIAVEDHDPRRAAEMANAYVDELRRLTQDFAVTEASQRRLFFERQLQLAKNNMADAEQALKHAEQKTGIIEPEGQAKIILESVVKLRAAIAAKEVELESRRLFSTEQNPDLVLGEQELSGMRAELSRLEKRGPASETEISPGSLPAGDVPEAGLEYLRKLRDLKYAETIFELLARQYEAARLDEARNAAVIQVLDPAIEPDRKSGPPRTLIVSLTTLAALFGSAGWVIAAGALRRMRSHPDLDVRWIMLKQSVFRTQP
jgi:tyrosine-protein kinase Etk/Wzc